MKRFISLAALALIASTANATAIPGLYRWMVPYADASMTTSEYLADRYGVDKADVAVQDVAILPDEGKYSTVAHVASNVCQVTLEITSALNWKQSGFAVKLADCSPASNL